VIAPDGAERARRLHLVRFGREPAHRSRASGRVNLIGDHIDYAGGTVLPMALHEATYACASPSDGDRFASEWDGDRDWTRYAAGVLAELRNAGIPLAPLAISIASDVPVGAGLSSSAALEVAVARAALASAGRSMPAGELALLCQRAEHVHAGTPCGIMDQWCVAHAAAGEAIALDCGSLAWRRVKLPPALTVEVADSGVRHRLRDGGYASRRADVDNAARALGVDRLALLPESRWHEIDALHPLVARRAHHVVREHRRVLDAIAALMRGDLAAFGRCMNESHASLRDDFDVSVPELDAIVEAARASGAVGARLTGGGFGGSVVIVRG
jgi:galactokinase